MGKRSSKGSQAGLPQRAGGEGVPGSPQDGGRCGKELAHWGACTRGLWSLPMLPDAMELLKVTGRAGPQEGQADGVGAELCPLLVHPQLQPALQKRHGGERL